MSFVVDLIIVALFAIAVIIYAKKGFVFSLIKVVGTICALMLATNVGNFLTNTVYNKVIEPKIVSIVMESVDNGVDNATESTFDTLPDFIKDNGEMFGITEENVEALMPTEIVSEKEVKGFLDETVEPIASNLLSPLFTLICFVVFSWVVGFLSKFVNKFFTFSVVGSLNKWLGGVIGLPIGLSYAAILCLVLKIIVSVSPNGLWIFTSKAVNSSTLYNLISPLIDTIILRGLL